MYVQNCTPGLREAISVLLKDTSPMVAVGIQSQILTTQPTGSGTPISYIF